MNIAFFLSPGTKAWRLQYLAKPNRRLWFDVYGKPLKKKFKAAPPQEFDAKDPNFKLAIEKEVTAHEKVFRQATQEEINNYIHRKMPCKLLLKEKRDGRRNLMAIRYDPSTKD